MYLATMSDPVQYRITCLPSEQPSTTSQWTGNARDRPRQSWFVRLNSTSKGEWVAS